MLSPASQSGFQTEMKAEEIVGGGGDRRIQPKKTKTSGRRNEEGEEEEMRANFLSIFITVHFIFYQSQRHLRRLARYTGTNTQTRMSTQIFRGGSIQFQFN